MGNLFFALVLILTFQNCGATYQPSGAFKDDNIPTAPDYSNPDSWAALPTTKDKADCTPARWLKDKQATAAVDVFFLHPTIYVGDKHEDQWNGPINDRKFNKKVDKSAILNQASIFNAAGRVYAPRYRQAHIYSYFPQESEKEAADKAFELAYSDIKAAFEYYMAHFNNGRPIIIAGHSQGTGHAGTLLREFFDGKPLQDQLVAAYLVGMPVAADYFKNIKPCQTADEIGCFCSWRTWERGHAPKNMRRDANIIVTNPLLWTTDTTYAEASLNKGAVLRKFKKVRKGLTDAQVHKSILWARKPNHFWSFLIKFSNYHIADYNLYYVNVRENAVRRAAAFLSK